MAINEEAINNIRVAVRNQLLAPPTILSYKGEEVKEELITLTLKKLLKERFGRLLNNKYLLFIFHGKLGMIGVNTDFYKEVGDELINSFVTDSAISEQPVRLFRLTDKKEIKNLRKLSPRELYKILRTKPFTELIVDQKIGAYTLPQGQTGYDDILKEVFMLESGLIINPIKSELIIITKGNELGDKIFNNKFLTFFNFDADALSTRGNERHFSIAKICDNSEAVHNLMNIKIAKKVKDFIEKITSARNLDSKFRIATNMLIKEVGAQEPSLKKGDLEPIVNILYSTIKNN